MFMRTCLILLLFSLFTAASCFNQDQVYIVYLGEHKGTKTIQAIQENHHSILLHVKNKWPTIDCQCKTLYTDSGSNIIVLSSLSEEAARGSLLYSYKNSINGFAAILSDEEAAKISDIEDVVSAFPSQGRSSLHTTRSWEFMGMEEGLSNAERESTASRENYGSDVIVGMIDSGIWPESKSFNDKGMGPIPKKWKGVCQEGDAFNASSCNKKLIGARYYVKGYEAYYGPLNTAYAYRSPRDNDGHGTHTASTVGGRVVRDVSALGGFASGTVSGGAPLARLAVYKVCWPIPGPNPNLENTCFDADMLAAFDDAIGDGVHVISMSIGAQGVPPRYSSDSMAIGALHAAKEDIVVACSAGNSGPSAATVVNLAPWMITVGASSIDRAFPSSVLLGSGKKIEGQTVTPYGLEKGKMYPLVYAGNAEVPDTPKNVSGQCLPNSLALEAVAGKVVVCFRGAGFRVGKGVEVKRADGAAIVLGNSAANGNEIAVDAHVLPGVGVSFTDAVAIMNYINSTRNPTITIRPAATAVGVRPAPVMAAFSSRGPNRVEPNILKPDVTAPGLNILAAWSETSAPTKVDGDPRRVKYNLMSGTSMACPHVGATAALLKYMYPSWSSAAIRSAIMTTATRRNTKGDALTTETGEAAGPMDYGSGHIRPSHASDPGLVYDANYTDYLLFACSSIKAQMDPTYPCPENPPSPSSLNYPSVSVTGLSDTVEVTREVTNVGQPKATYKVRVQEPNGVKVDITPKKLRFRKVGEKKSFVIKMKEDGKGSGGGWVGGSFTWSDGTHVVTSPIVVTLK